MANDDHEALHQRVQELERGLEEARAQAAAGKVAQAEVERLREAFAKTQHELEEIRKIVPQEADPRRRRASFVFVGIAGAAAFVAGAAVFLVISRAGPVAPPHVPEPGAAERAAAPAPPAPPPASRPADETPEEKIMLGLLREHGAEVRGCYLKELKANPGLEGKVYLVLTIDGGRVAAEIAEGSTLNNANVEACIVDVARRWSVPFRGHSSYKFPLVFRTSE